MVVPVTELEKKIKLYQPGIQSGQKNEMRSGEIQGLVGKAEHSAHTANSLGEQ